ncbi:MAG: putative DNA binding domain-containing protein [Oscillospiraceae bacterium]|nr:putative DNA binding domain-containing protein [Oscillospiraceae bacterium]
MDTASVLEMIKRGEDSRHQFKRNVNNADSLAADMVAFSNGDGGIMLIGVSDDGAAAGLTGDDARRLNQLVSNVASQHVQPAINPITENIRFDDSLIIIINISSGINKPYQDKNGVFWVKSGADKRKATSREEIQRMFQKSNLLHADEMPVAKMTIEDFDMRYFSYYFQKRYGSLLEDEKQPLPRLLENMGLMQGDKLTLCGALLFTKEEYHKLPVFIVKAGSFDANDLTTNNYQDSRNIEGRLESVYNQTVSFIVSNLRHIQGEQDFNSIGIPEIPHEAIRELVANALIHRDYFVSAPIRVFVFRNRVEIISPGHLPNNLTIENILLGVSNTRNQLLASHANHLIPYRGYGSGIINALEAYPDIEFIDDRDGNQFKAILKRR